MGAGDKRRLAHVVHTYYAPENWPDLDPPDEETAEFLALPYESYAQAFTTGLLSSAFESGHAVDSTLLTAAGYQDRTSSGDGWWTRSGRQVFDQDHFYLPVEVIDPFNESVTIGYDGYDLYVNTVTDPLGNVVTAQLDYRVLAPWEVTDPNGNRSRAAFDDLGRVIKSAVMGKDGDTDGDTSPTRPSSSRTSSTATRPKENRRS